MRLLSLPSPDALAGVDFLAGNPRRKGISSPESQVQEENPENF
jgi:hypothetical protein